MKYGFFSGILWGLDTVILGIGLAMAPYVGTVAAAAFASIVGSFLHDAFCAIWLFGYMALKGRLKDTVAALKTRSVQLSWVLWRWDTSLLAQARWQMRRLACLVRR